MGCGESLVKYILFFANLVFALAGLTLIGLGIAAKLQVSAITNQIDVDLYGAPIFCMVIGGIVFLISFFGCCGAIRESNCMLITYSVFMMILMLLKVTLGILIFVGMQAIVEEILKWLDKVFKNDQEQFHGVEATFKCCGTDGALTYMNLALPKSCCAPDANVCIALNAYAGCNTVVVRLFDTLGIAIGSIFLVVAAIELIAVIFGCCLATHVRNKNRRSRY